jgi:osmotically-inducible protein OsmY
MSADFREGHVVSRLKHAVQLANDRLRCTPQIRGANVSCRCVNGALRLQGQLASYYQKQVAQEVVKQVASVQELVNRGLAELVNEIEVTK